MLYSTTTITLTNYGWHISSHSLNSLERKYYMFMLKGVAVMASLKLSTFKSNVFLFCLPILVNNFSKFAYICKKGFIKEHYKLMLRKIQCKLVIYYIVIIQNKVLQNFQCLVSLIYQVFTYENGNFKGKYLLYTGLGRCQLLPYFYLIVNKICLNRVWFCVFFFILLMIKLGRRLVKKIVHMVIELNVFTM